MPQHVCSQAGVLLALASPSIICNDKSHDQQTPYNSTVVIRNRQQSY